MPKEPVTRNDVAAYAGVSTAVVSYVVNEGPRKVAPETRDRVLTAIRVLGYRPNATARALRMGTTRTFGLITPDGGNPLFAELAKAIDKEAAARGYVVLQTSADGDPETERAKIAELLVRQVSGLVLVAPTADPDLSAAEVPAIAINRVLPKVSSIRPAYREGARQGVRHLIEHGHRRIALVIGDASPNRAVVAERDVAAGEVLPVRGVQAGHRAARAERELGWGDALRAAGLAPGLVVRVPFSRAGGRTAGDLLLAATERPTAVFASSDLQAIGVLRAVREAGLRVPEDLAVVAFDGTPETEYSWPPLTVVRQPLELLAREAVDRLIAGEQTVEALTLPTDLVVRRSCGCPN
ncbi:LacI family DNA-binding transcriptional regulator [Kribbella solani]|uniref:LacI family DNA-binding transcriptional regulator n=1 Tax=Kribbella solani TaxID=236067 RepID=UPI0029A9B6C8|nr:LacI family DNA-binding transcriptional regulator [Kribbella solani]MDX3007090.1 LacI family DNA-binding transcriptional regulator [Kribbella solani]